ncbi:MAG TPA: tetratricopeptide repeat protein [Pyrinomonadaceae bacterium]|jgi:tetratricopeptide (TPR) repeat protein|nr:tetratricopeptide repeat protein [Pyrinomonadaceae bacterium]
MIHRYFKHFLLGVFVIVNLAGLSWAQSSRPRRVKAQPPPAKPAEEPLLRPEPKASPTAKNTSNRPLIDVQPVKPVVNTVGAGDTTHAYELLKQKQFAAAAKEAKDIAAQFPNDSEAWKIAGFAELSLKQYALASDDLEKALNLQEVAKGEDPNTEDALAQAYVLSEKFDRALPLLVKATARSGTAPDPSLLYYRGLAEYKTGKPLDAEKTFTAVIKANPKDTPSLFYLGQIALAKNDLDGAIASLNRATVTDPRFAAAWTLLTSAYLRRAALTEDTTKAAADYLSAVRAGEGLIKVKTDAEAVTLFGQALIGSEQYPRAAAALERATLEPDAKGVTFYLLGIAQSRAKNFPKAILALQTAVQKSPDDVNVYRELGYAYEMTKQYAKALAVYQKGLSLAPADTDFKEAVERVRPFAK